MEGVSIWEAILAGLLAAFFIFWFRGGIKARMEESRNAPKDWMGALIPIALVVLFVIFLIAIVR